MLVRTAAIAMFLLVLLARPSSAGGGRHPHFNDQGTLTWYPTLCEAMEAARAEDKVILMECGRRRCVQCRRLCCQVLPSCEVRERVARVAVGYAANCDCMEPVVDALVKKHLPKANVLPFVGFLRADGTWITGFAGGRNVEQFLGDLAAAEEALASDRAARRRTEPDPLCRAKAEEAARRGAWGEVVRLCRQAGHADPVMAEMKARARGWARGRLDSAVLAAREQKFAEARALAEEVRHAMQGETEANDAARGLHAIDRASAIGVMDRDSTEFQQARSKAIEESRGTRWAQIFG
jgi:hypothetical protein